MDSSTAVPYQAYKSKRHSRNSSSQQLVNAAPPPQPRPPTVYGNGHTLSEPVVPAQIYASTEFDSPRNPGAVNGRSPILRPASMMATLPRHEAQPSNSVHLDDPLSSREYPLSTMSAPYQITPPSPAMTLPPSPSKPASPAPNGKGIAQSSPVAGPSTLSSPAHSDKSLPGTRRSSTFRHVPLRPVPARQSLSSSPLRPSSMHVRTSDNMAPPRHLEPPRENETPDRIRSSSPTSLTASYDRTLPVTPSIQPHRSSTSPTPEIHAPVTTRSLSPAPIVPPPRGSSLMSSPTPQTDTRLSVSSPALTPSTSTSSAASFAPVRAPVRFVAPYRPGFQPNGVCRLRTDEFIEARKSSRDVGRIERTRLERRLEKLIALHFSSEQQHNEKRPLQQARRASSIWDLDIAELKNKSAGDLWRGVLQTQTAQSGKGDIRAAEQTITPWEDDASVSQCPLCSASFHPLTNRKHHCRLCGRIICSLPVKYPQRPETCSLLFVADPSTGRIEEVGEGVDYGVRRRSTVTQGKTKGKEETLSEDEKFLKGVRICRDCRPVLLRRQYKQEFYTVPIFSKLYDAFISLEKEIEDALPQFQELMLSLSKHERPTPEASAARKRLVEAFSQYDALSKRILKIPCPGGPGSSQDRIQAAIVIRANLFLQKHMFPLQSLPKPKKAGTSSSTNLAASEDQVIDPDSEVARVLQPLLEQEALLESFVEEAKTHRKFEDAKSLKINLQEIRAEIERILTNAEIDSVSKGKGRPRGS